MMERRDAEQKSKMKLHADNKSRARESSLSHGMVVLMKQPKQNKLSTPFDPNPFVVKEKKGTMVTASNEFKTVTQNSSQFKVVPSELFNEERNHEAEGERQENEAAAENHPSTTDPNQSEMSRLLRRSNRQRRPPARLNDYVTAIN